MATWAVTTSNARLEFDTQQATDNACIKIDTNHVVNFWQTSSGQGYTQVFTINTSTWAVTTANSVLSFEAGVAGYNTCCIIDSNHIINFWRESNSGDGFVQTFAINTTTWAITTAASPLEFDTQNAEQLSSFIIDSNHFILFYRGGAATTDSFAQVFTVNTSTWAVTTANNRLQFDTDIGAYNTCHQIDSNHFINVWQGAAGDGFAQTFTVNTSTWAVTTAASSLEFDTQNYSYGSIEKIDANHFILYYLGAATTIDGFAQVFTVNTTTWAVTTASSRFLFDTDVGSWNSCVQVDTNHFLNFWQGNSGDGFTQVFTVNTSTWAVTTANSQLEFDTTDCSINSCISIDKNHFINFWTGPSVDGFVQIFSVELPSNIKTYNTNVKANIKTINTNVIANCKTLNTNA